MFDPREPVWIESESSKIGEIHVPNQLFKHLMQSKGVRVDCDRARRAEYLRRDYQHLTEHPDKTRALIDKLTFRHSRAQVDAWQQLIDQNDWLQLADSLLEVHYDPAYAQSQKRLQVIADLSLEHPGELTDAVFNQLMDTV
jgi:tRNA 2-selenouridine synthase